MFRKTCLLSPYNKCGWTEPFCTVWSAPERGKKEKGVLVSVLEVQVVLMVIMVLVVVMMVLVLIVETVMVSMVMVVMAEELKIFRFNISQPKVLRRSEVHCLLPPLILSPLNKPHSICGIPLSQRYQGQFLRLLFIFFSIGVANCRPPFRDPRSS